MSSVSWVTPGVYAPALTFFKPETEELDLETFRRHIIYMAEAGVGPVVCGSMSEAPMLSENERLSLVKTAREALDSIDAKFPLIVGTGLASTKETIALTKAVAAVGADVAIVIVSGYYAPLMTKKAIKRFYIEVAKDSPVPVLMYNFPSAAGGLDMDSDLIEEIASASPNICGAKLTCSSIGKFTRLATNLNTTTFHDSSPRSWSAPEGQPSFVVLAGFTDFMMSNIFAKAHGAIAGMGNFAPYTLRKMYDLAVIALSSGSSESISKAQQLQGMLASADYQTTLLHIPGAKRLIQDRLGYGGIPREPIQPIDEDFYSSIMSHPSVIELFKLEDKLQAEAKVQ